MNEVSITRELLLRIPKCEEYPYERIARFLGNRKSATLVDMLEAPIDHEAKIWCFLHLKLITKTQKHLLACDFAEHVLDNIEVDSDRKTCKELVDSKRIQLAVNTHSEELNALRIKVRERIQKLRSDGEDLGQIAAIEASYFATDHDYKTALKNAGSCARAIGKGSFWDDEASFQIERVRQLLEQKL